LPPCTDQTGILPQPPGTFTSRLSTDRSSSPLLDITTTATGLLCWRDSHPLEWQLASLHGHSRPSRRARNATYDRSCLKADIRRAALRLVVEVEIAEHLGSGVADDERRGGQLRRSKKKPRPTGVRHGASWGTRFTSQGGIPPGHPKARLQ
jgi:hypothetical protein